MKIRIYSLPMHVLTHHF